MKRIELESMMDLAYLAASSPLGAIIQHFKDKVGTDVYFLIGGTIRESFVYYFKGEEIKKRFINLNTTQNKIEYTDLPIFDPKIKVVPIIEIKAQDLLDLGQ
ncbi:MAG: hypothetical protein L6M37_02625 [Candidatus Methylarchaceae archaeon HK02M1]|nr:hypothetical protein [Candidatus Methylarchaceae archaeon HK02M1]